jgi:cytosine/adenosine deaminase-related metal-dependent hydrolase
VDRSESERLARTRTLVALSPRADVMLEPQGGGLESVFAHENLTGIGTGGAGSLWEELAAAFVEMLRVGRLGRMLEIDDRVAQLLIADPAELCSMLYGAPSGSVEEGSVADLVLYDLVPAKDKGGGIATRLLLQLSQASAAWTVVAGRVVVREGQLLGHDLLELATEASRALQAIRDRA